MTNPSPQDFIKFVLKLSSEGSGLERSVAVEAVTSQLRAYEKHPLFPVVFAELCPDNFYPTTKSLPPYQIEILTDAIQSYCES